MRFLFYLLTILFVISFIYIIKTNKEIFNIVLDKKKEKLILIIFCFITSIAQILLLNSNYPYIGHDYAQIEARAISMFIYYQNNGLDIEWASPLFGGGLLSYANPNWHQYSPLYFLTLIMPFWYSYNLLTFLFSIVGFISVYLLLKKDFNFNFISSLTGAVFFSCTGYYIYHLKVGHWTFIYHPLTALIVFIFFSNTISKVKFSFIIRILSGAIIFSAMIFGGAIHTIFFYTCFVLLGMAAIFFKLNLDFFKKCLAIICSVLISFILSLSKIIPMFILSAKIDRGELMVDNVPFHKIFEVIYYYFILSFVSFLEKLFSLNLFFHIKYSAIWENDLSLPFLIIPLMIIIFIINKKEIKEHFYNLNKFDKFKIFLFIIWIYLIFDIYYDKGIINSLFPFLKKINLRLRISSTLILPFSIFLSYLLNKYKLFNRKKSLILLLLLNIYTIIFFLYKHADTFNNEIAFRNVNIEIGKEVWNKINNLGSNNNYKIYTILSFNEQNDEYRQQLLKQFISNNSINLYSAQFPYEPIYGYRLETFKAKDEGSIYKISNNYYNFTHPNSLIFFNDEYKQFTGFSLEQKDDLDKFASFKKVDWKLPKIFYIANDVSLYSHIIVCSLLILIIIFNIIFAVKKKY
ncbi:hypothetical protein [Brachyspira sp. SAP_772]|uniref:hypothetical protein n=1 Tax=Brachyspira sp. SAP_772 TaxID=2608385 RepID=UPI0012F4F832|nr:hypothetical protein [Brachyspira sp. SAP_772]